jgi:tRNA A37 threonylcarbamoyladenosine biosynthesis protein TsaE
MTRLERLAQLLREHKRIAIVGGPGTGKTTLAANVSDRRVLHTDDYVHRPWASVPDDVIRACEGLESFVVEGVQVARSLRRGLKVDAVIYLDAMHGAGSQSMAKAVDTVFRDWRSKDRLTPVFSPDR